MERRPELTIIAGPALEEVHISFIKVVHKNVSNFTHYLYIIRPVYIG
jgi:hypothetical protein